MPNVLCAYSDIFPILKSRAILLHNVLSLSLPLSAFIHPLLVAMIDIGGSMHRMILSFHHYESGLPTKVCIVPANSDSACVRVESDWRIH